ncbi:MAG: hypothetical protein SFY66_13545 [Oculatellaceae cyanobacterium bins.114]|nr:hypothetical protein [Oculatellaceae cyanobacterium bins.114]
MTQNLRCRWERDTLYWKAELQVNLTTIQAIAIFSASSSCQNNVSQLN